MDFNKSIFENRKSGVPFLVSHRGVNCANVPCNTMLAFKTAIAQGADVVELDVSKSRDGVFFVFHPGTEKVFLKCGKTIPEMDCEEVKNCRLLNLDEVPTHYGIPTLEEAFLYLKGKAYINVDKFWTDIEGISEVIKKCGVEKQVIVKTPVEEKYFKQIEEYARGFMYMPLTRHTDTVTEILRGRNINYIGVEAIFDTVNDEVATADYIERMHQKGLLVWANSIVYDEKEVVSAFLTDDISLECGGERGWGVLIDRGFDFIQTDWLYALKCYLESNKK